MIEPYNAVGLVPTMWGIDKREDIFKNIEHHKHMLKAACWLSDIDLPVQVNGSRFAGVVRSLPGKWVVEADRIGHSQYGGALRQAADRFPDGWRKATGQNSVIIG